MTVVLKDENIEPQAIEACAIARDLESFDLLIEDLENKLGESWGGLDFDNAEDILRSSHADTLKFITIALDKTDEDDLTIVDNIIKAARDRDIKIILVTHDLSAISLHKLMRLGADDFVPYPIPENALLESIDRVLAAKEEKVIIKEVFVLPEANMAQPAQQKQGILLPVYGSCGGVGATTFSTNLAWEMQEILREQNKTVCILDFDFQFGSVATYLDVAKSEAAFEMISNIGNADNDSFKQVVSMYKNRLAVLPSPQDAVPLEFIGPEDVKSIIDLARSCYDVVVIDIPRTLVSWSEVVLNECELFLCLVSLDMRSAQNVQRFMRALKAEDLPFEKVQFILNRAPKMTDLSGKSRLKSMTESLGIELRWQLADGGKHVPSAGDHGAPLAEMAAKNPLRKDIAKIAETFAELCNDEQLSATAG
ncbi:MAG: AAA family ATPase [Proteobacteria bacterium]|nr:AAA family ATPase [Pseudomonadota bacterium]